MPNAIARVTAPDIPQARDIKRFLTEGLLINSVKLGCLGVSGMVND